jgi:hypothetical protein
MDGDDQLEGSSGGPKRLPYEAPSIAWEEALPARPGLTMACGKIDGTIDAACSAALAS